MVLCWYQMLLHKFEWMQLPKLGRKYGPKGKPSADISEYIRTWTTVISKQVPELQLCLEGTSAKGKEVELLALEWFEPVLGASTRQSFWRRAPSPSIK